MNPRGNPALAQYRFKKGQSGNPAGRPKAFSIHRLVAEALDEGTLREALDAFPQGAQERRALTGVLGVLPPS